MSIAEVFNLFWPTVSKKSKRIKGVHTKNKQNILFETHQKSLNKSENMKANPSLKTHDILVNLNFVIQFIFCMLQ